jgi:hypothetical protein
MPGQTQPWRSSVGDGGVGAALEGGGRKRRVRSVPVRAPDERGGSGHLGEGAPAGAKQATARQTAGVRPAGCWALRRTEGRRLALLQKRSGRTVRDAARCEARGSNAAELGGTCGASRVGDTAESSSCAPSRASVRTMRGGAGGPGTPVRTKHEGEKMPRAKAKPREPFTRLGRAGLGSRVRPEVARCATAGRRRRTQPCAALPRGSPRGDRGIRGTPAGRRPEKNTLRDVRSAHRSEPLRREATAPHRVGICGAACAEIWGDRL